MIIDKNYFIMLFMLLTGVIQAQLININNSADVASSYDLEQLVEDVLIASDCAEISNFSQQVYGAPTDTQTKSYGYFETPSGSNFPFESGVVLTTGRAYSAGNVRVRNNPFPDFDNGLSGDADLEDALSQNNTNDASFVKFNFIPTSNDFNFRFLMASEEYDGSTECTFSDSFAFLLREVGTTAYTNLAILPDGTPVSVTNINDAAACRANVEYFAGYNLGSTNYGGRTEVLTANAVVTPNQAYEIKIVVADQLDSAYDSAIFLEAGSFNLGLDLGEDVTFATGNPACGNTTLTLNTQVSSTTAPHKWFRNGIEIVGETNSTLDVTTAGEYSVSVAYGTTCIATAEITIEFTGSPIANPVGDQFICDDNNDGFNTYNFQLFNDTVLGTQSPIDYTVTYHMSQEDANNNANAITTAYTNQNAYQLETIYVRVEDNTFNYCFATTSFDIAVFNSLTESNPLPLYACDDDSDGFNAFDLTLVESDILNALPAANYNFSYYEDQDEAVLGNATQIATPTNYNNTVADEQIVYVRVQPITNECFQVVPVTLIVHPLLDVNLNEQYLICLAADDSVLAPVETDTALQTAPIDTELSETEYLFQWYEGEQVIAANSIVGATQSSYNATTIGFYTVEVTNIISGCTYVDTTEVVSSYPPETISVEVLTDAFSENSMLAVTVTGVGFYEYSLYEGYWQYSPIFENVLGGDYIVKVRDVYNCETLEYEVPIINYPKVFTPNNDGFNDTWNILGVKNQGAVKVTIYDRYGKLIKQLNASSLGWDGTYEGEAMPTSDYWFVVEYVEPLSNTQKEFSAHFTLKR
ncbi:T9SS type B sorting domain-containing protein [Lacinutrix sp. C3R15]|uniref:T9SS type B sorting domain-containing protein n=1 Tax=Flavobacteriaceae TaxID=49546 RepID=UPI001C07FF5B|nr:MULTISPECIES: choice-of-anchor L domain-containing protein [Flavobacteriaceae]MBU2938792.1 T9SS type B sorting domain-containing protein [Lacinutrix sp. C3R15]MDO6622105.1 choice-of-anchor L domain-containing protein [Oceanihabitans sp. 1_MG-2023]